MANWKLQQYLPFTVLKLYTIYNVRTIKDIALQQYLPFTVLKQFCLLYHAECFTFRIVATVLTVYGIET